MLFVLLAIHPTYQQKLRREVEVSFQDGTYNSAKPQDLLDGIINEALRLFPPATFTSQRVTPAEGLTIGNVHIPPDTVISVGTYQIHHGMLFFPVSRNLILTSCCIDKRNFVKPNDFIPERWSSKPELILNKNAFMPFSMG